MQIDAYLPLRERRYTYPSKTVIRQLPILPGYVFVRPEAKHLSAVLTISHVFGFVKSAGKYALVTEQEVDHLKRLSTTRDLDWCEVSEEEITAGTPVKIIRGSLSGLRGRLIERKDQKVFLISFNDKMTTQLGTFEVTKDDFEIINEMDAA